MTPVRNIHVRARFSVSPNGRGLMIQRTGQTARTKLQYIYNRLDPGLALTAAQFRTPKFLFWKWPMHL